MYTYMTDKAELNVVLCIKRSYRITGKFGEYYNYLANESFERNWQILIWRLRRGYYSTDVASTGKL